MSFFNAVRCVAIASLVAASGIAIKDTRADEASALGAPSGPGICAVLGLPEAGRPESVIELAGDGRLQVYFQSADAETVAAVRRLAAARGLLGSRVVAAHGAVASIQLASNLADQVRVADSVSEQVAREEILRVLRPEGVALVGGQQLTKPRPAAVDSWSHVYHGPDNNPQSTDRLARAPYRTQFLAAPLFSPMPEVTVAAGGRIFKAFGHIAHKANQNAVLNTLHCINAHNGVLLWKRPLSPGFMIHRSTMIATPDTFFLADDKSCKLIEPATGQVRGEIFVPEGLADGPVWKWMALQDGILYALVGGPEIKVDTITSGVRGLGHWPWGMWKGHDYADPRTNFGFGRTFLAIDPQTREILWSYRDPEFIDSRGVCMRGSRIYFYSPEKFLACLDTRTRSVEWKNSDPSLLQAIGPNGRAQHYVTGYATTSYIKCNDDQLFFAGPQRERFVVASTEDGRVLWQKRQGNLQVVLRDEGVYCAGPQKDAETAGAVYSYDGQRLTSLPIRRACTRATGSIDSVFYRTTGGTVRVNTADKSAHHIAPMRPPCQDGVVISDGMLFWGPWMCGCQLSLYGHIALGPAEGSASPHGTTEPQRHVHVDQPTRVQTLDVAAEDWPAYQHDSALSSFTTAEVPEQIVRSWDYQVVQGDLPTAPIIAGDMVFVGDRSGVVQALGSDGQRQWSFATGGPIYFPPVLDAGRLYAGSADGHVYAWEAVTGRLLWTYRVAPEARRMPVYGKLISTWPVAGGVVVDNGVVYAAAGIAHYDGTYIVALDAVDGHVVWSNDSSGTLSSDVNCGISLQGELQLRGGELQFLGGGAYLLARYDRQTGKCLNEPRHEVTSQFQTAFYPYYPDYAKYAPLNHTFPGGRTLFYNPSYDGSRPTPLGLLAPADSATAKPSRKPGASDRPVARPQRAAIWHTEGPRRFNAFALTRDTLLAGGAAADDQGSPQLTALSIADGSVCWQQPLDALPVKSGIAIDAQQRIVVTLENGRLVCFEPASAP